MTLPTDAYRHSSSSYFDATVDVPRREGAMLHTQETGICFHGDACGVLTATSRVSQYR